MALGCEVDHGAGLVLGQEALHQSTVANVALHKNMAGVDQATVAVFYSDVRSAVIDQKLSLVSVADKRTPLHLGESS
jgi:hypothetical protein